ncbi:hypothetical protein TBLA_0C01540 [Henningerozyma blattae CBS 6284]|uniref:Translation initiation factor IF-2, mitochondrial n=1 Tax=Henningerozyma blattae (strain ATCC 34711 / CBS 6284 / DSM 70876 / NBRC 10599 / NRRL Y-10934 / UCD 77-7) TaxID=1071380 RepID=I2H0R6_HENB6|nr:hypothetical protein TBLA_0C01540 [Tetrapisispora blattae CBS 6284]CCH59968.1 hypothetical protein TBLA_0C01540 [Tetrapisispora blattae CBS 6284]
MLYLKPLLLKCNTSICTTLYTSPTRLLPSSVKRFTHIIKRPPIVSILGHVDHGKTTLLDNLIKNYQIQNRITPETTITSTEFGGITQKISTFSLHLKNNLNITILDTPGHKTFSKMRKRNTQIPDILLLLVSIQDGILTQTVETINHLSSIIQEANENDENPPNVIVVVTKLDLIKDSNERNKKLNKIKNDLLNYNIVIEEFGGDIQFIPISSITGFGMNDLIDSMVALTDILQLDSDLDSPIKADVIETSVNNKIGGKIVNVLVKQGNIKQGSILIGSQSGAWCKVRRILSNSPQSRSIDDKQEIIPIGGPSQVVSTLGWKNLDVIVGEQIIGLRNESDAKKLSKEILKNIENENVNNNTSTNNNTLETSDSDSEIVKPKTKKINFIIKADTQGSLEAVIDSIRNFGNDEVRTCIVAYSVGQPTINDKKLAEITNSTILCFNLDNSNSIKPDSKPNENEKIKIKYYNVIYKLIDDVTEILTENLPQHYETKILATLTIKEVFNYKQRNSTYLKIAGCKVLNGKIMHNSNVKIIRDDEEIYKGKVKSLKHGKDDVTELNKGNECGLVLDDFDDFLANDIIEAFEDVPLPKTL